MSAHISECGKYRYTLARKPEVENPDRGTALFIMLNPSTADAQIDDATIRRCRGFAKSWSCNGITVANLYAYRATNPNELWTVLDPIGTENEGILKNLIAEHLDVICAWGGNAQPERVAEFMKIVSKIPSARLWCLGQNKDGSPKHPLYIKANQTLIPFNIQQTKNGEKNTNEVRE